jgi:hypothetical protein
LDQIMGDWHKGRGSSAFDADSPWRNGCRSGRSQWAPFEIAAMVMGFVLFWPIGLAILFAKLWQRSHGDERDLADFVRERANAVKETFWGVDAPPMATRFAESVRRSSGNQAFDEWREAELARLERERVKLAQAEREFAKHIEELRRARDREEFESFMRARGGGSSTAQ